MEQDTTTEVRRVLGPWSASALITGAMIGTGIFFFVSDVAVRHIVRRIPRARDVRRGDGAVGIHDPRGRAIPRFQCAKEFRRLDTGGILHVCH